MTDFTGMTDLTDLLTRPGPWTSLYLDGPDGSPARDREARRTSLRDRMLRAGAPEPDVDAALDVLGDEGPPAPSARIVLVRDGAVELNEFHPGPRLGPEVIVHGRVPRVVPLLRERDQVPYLIVEVGREGGQLRLAHGTAGTVDDSVEVEGRTDTLTKVQAGGWSHARYQRAAEEVWRANADEVAEAVERMVREHDPAFVIVSGDVRARELLLEELSPESAERVVEVATHTRAAGASSESLDAEIGLQLDEQRERERQDLLSRSATGGGRRGERGLGAVVHALQQAQVESVLLDPRGDERSLLALDGPPWIATDPGERLSTEVLEEVPAIEGLARAAILTGARVLFLDPEPDDPASPRSAQAPHEPVATVRWPTGPEIAGSDG
jgi:hypothetical protein